MTAGEWTAIRPEDVREGDRVRLTVEGNPNPGHDGVSEGIAAMVFGDIHVCGWAVTLQDSIAKVERATPPLPVEPGTVIDATVRGARARVVLADPTASNLRWFSVLHDGTDFVWCADRDLADWSPVAPAPGGGEK